MKINIMMKKENLEKGIYIDDDLTKRERERDSRKIKKNGKRGEEEKKGGESELHENVYRWKMV